MGLSEFEANLVDTVLGLPGLQSEILSQGEKVKSYLEFHSEETGYPVLSGGYPVLSGEMVLESQRKKFL